MTFIYGWIQEADLSERSAGSGMCDASMLCNSEYLYGVQPSLSYALAMAEISNSSSVMRIMTAFGPITPLSMRLYRMRMEKILRLRKEGICLARTP